MSGVIVNNMPHRLKSHLQNWVDIDANEQVLEWIDNGVKLPLTNIPAPFELHNRSFSSKQYSFIDAEIKELVAKGVLCEVSYKPHCVSPVSCVPKKGGKLRLITDLRCLNSYIEAPKFSSENMGCAINLIQSEDLMVTVDLKDGFFHIPVHPDDQKYLGIYWNGRYLIFTALPFGLNASPYFFHKIIRCVVQALRKQNVRMMAYVDDFMLMAGRDLIDAQKKILLDMLRDLGFLINWRKSMIDPDSTVTFLGHVLDSMGSEGVPEIRVTMEKVRVLRKDIRRAIQQGRISARILARIAGQCIFATQAVIPGKLLLRNIYRQIAQRQSWDQVMLLQDATLKELDWWFQALYTWNGRPIKVTSVDHQMFTDASHIGWGAVMDSWEAQGFWNNLIAYKSSNFREIMAIFMAIVAAKEIIRGKCIQVMSDNITAIAYISHLGGPSQELTQVAIAIWRVALMNGITIKTHHVPGRLNGPADYLSRLSPMYEWQLNSHMFNHLDFVWGKHTIDRFITMMNAHIPVYNSRFADPFSSGVDALSQRDWGVHNNFVNAPFRMIQKVLNVIVEQEATATIIAPDWKAQAWYNLLIKLSIADPIWIPRRAMLGFPNAEPLKNNRWKVYAWRVSAKHISQI